MMASSQEKIESGFAIRKQNVMTSFFEEDSKHGSSADATLQDLSPKGSIDTKILPLLRFINSLEEYYTTSSCSGRISVFEKPSGRWLLASHDKITVLDLLNALQTRQQEAEDIVFKFEPFILAVECSNLKSAAHLTRFSIDFGYRESGMIASPVESPKRFIVTIRSSNRLESPLLSGEFSHLSEEYLNALVQIANRKMDLNESRCLDYFEKLKLEFSKNLGSNLIQNHSSNFNCIAVSKSAGKSVKEYLQKQMQWADTKNRKVVVDNSDSKNLLIPITVEAAKKISVAYTENGIATLNDLFSLSEFYFSKEGKVPIILRNDRQESENLNSKSNTEKKLVSNPRDAAISRLLDTKLINEPEILSNFPKKWEIFGGDLILFPEGSFSSESWEKYIAELGEKFWTVILEVFKVTRIGIQNRIDSSLKRKSQVKLLFGDNGWVKHKENGIIFNFDVTKVMFASGNGTEKKRITELVQPGETVVDLYAGIGYFTLPLLVKAKLKKLYACEWNPDAIEALEKNVVLNKIPREKIQIIRGDNRLLKVENIADRVSLGLIPSSEDGWSIGIQVLKPTGGWLHIHANVQQDSEFKYSQLILKRLREIAKHSNNPSKILWHFDCVRTVKVKSYAPKVNHVVFDVYCEPEESLLDSMCSLSAHEKLCLISRTPVPIINPQEFNRFRRSPVLIRGQDLGACVDKWNLPYLKDSIGDKIVSIHVAPNPEMDFNNKNFVYKKTTFSHFVSLLDGSARDEYFVSPNEKYYLRSLAEKERSEVANLFRDFPSISQDFVLPTRLINNDAVFSTVLRLSSPECRLWTHYDIVDNVLCHIRGRKKVILFPPSDVRNLYVDSSSSSVLDVEGNSMDELVRHYPKFLNCRPFECILEPGDVLFIPALWFHNVICLPGDPAVSVNVFWKELDSMYYADKDLYGNKDHKIGSEFVESCVGNAEALIQSSLPPFYSDFYIHKMISKVEKFIRRY